MTEYPTNSRELDATTLIDMMDVEVGEEMWVPISPIRGDKFRAAKVVVVDRVSANNYEEHHAIDKWPQSDRYPISHEWSDGNPSCWGCGSPRSEETDSPHYCEDCEAAVEQHSELLEEKYDSKTDLLEQVEEMLRSAFGATIPEIADELGEDRESVRQAVEEISREHEMGSSSRFRYKILETDDEVNNS